MIPHHCQHYNHHKPYNSHYNSHVEIRNSKEERKQQKLKKYSDKETTTMNNSHSKNFCSQLDGKRGTTCEKETMVCQRAKRHQEAKVYGDKDWKQELMGSLFLVANELRHSRKGYRAQLNKLLSSRDKESNLNHKFSEFGKRKKRLEQVRELEVQKKYEEFANKQEELSSKIQEQERQTFEKNLKLHDKRLEREKEAMRRSAEYVEQLILQKRSTNSRRSERHEELIGEMERNFDDETRRKNYYQILEDHEQRKNDIIQREKNDLSLRNYERLIRHEEIRKEINLQQQLRDDELRNRIQWYDKKVNCFLDKRKRELCDKQHQAIVTYQKELNKLFERFEETRQKRLNSSTLPKLWHPIHDPLGKSKKKRCTLCEHLFSVESMQLTMAKKVKAQRAEWGLLDETPILQPGTIYNQVHVCVFCFQLLLPQIPLTAEEELFAISSKPLLRDIYRCHSCTPNTVSM